MKFTHSEWARTELHTYSSTGNEIPPPQFMTVVS